MTFQQLLYVLEISKCGSINKAAQRLFLSQSSISNAIKELELELGISILNRNNRGVEFTLEGKEFLSLAKSLLDKKQFIEDIYKKEAVSASHSLHISSQHYPFVIDAFTRFVNTYADPYQFQIRTAAMDVVLDDVYHQRSELGVIFFSDSTEHLCKRLLSSKNIIFHELTSLQPCIFVNKQHPLASKITVTFEDLNDFTYLCFENNLGTPSDLSEEININFQKKPEQIIMVNDHCAAINIIVHTNAFTTGSGLLSKGFVDTNLVTIPIEGRERVHLGYLHRSDYHLPTEAEHFVAFLKLAIHDAVMYSKTQND